VTQPIDSVDVEQLVRNVDDILEHFADATLDLGAAGCGDMTPLIRGRIRELASGQILAVLSEEPAAHEGIPAWSRLTGHELVHVERGATISRFYIRKK
jgi:TusA-related sulfurtransferase